MTQDRYVIIRRYGNEEFVSEHSTLLTHKRLVHDIARGQFEGVTAIHWYCLEEHICEDASEDIAREVMTYYLDENGTLDGCPAIDFLEDHLGCEAVAEAMREYAA